MTGAVFAGAFVLGAQVVAILPHHLRDTIIGWFALAGAEQGFIRNAVLLPIDAALGDGRAVVSCSVSGLLSSPRRESARDRFAAATLAARVRRQATTERPQRAACSFHGGLARTLRRKEWRLLARDPSLFAHLGLQIVYTIPIAVVLLRSEALPTALALAPAIVVIAAQISASLAWLMVSGEDAPELMASAPVLASEVDRAKLTAIALPVFVVVALPLAGLALGIAAHRSPGGVVRHRWRGIHGAAEFLASDAGQSTRHAAAPLAIEADRAASSTCWRSDGRSQSC